jgi:hypothetical protein
LAGPLIADTAGRLRFTAADSANRVLRLGILWRHAVAAKILLNPDGRARFAAHAVEPCTRTPMAFEVRIRPPNHASSKGDP